MRKFFSEFKKFITRGNVLDLAVGIIIGGAFTGIVNGLSNYVLKPIINWLIALIVGKNGLENAVTFLNEVRDSNGKIDLANSIYIDWGAFISAIINFIIIALVLFTIVRVMNRIRENNEKLTKALKKYKLSKEDKKELKARGIKRSDRNAVKAYLEEKKAKEEEAKLLAEQEKLEKERLERLANPTVEDLLKQIKEVLENQAK